MLLRETVTSLPLPIIPNVIQIGESVQFNFIPLKTNSYITYYSKLKLSLFTTIMFDVNLFI